MKTWNQGEVVWYMSLPWEIMFVIDGEKLLLRTCWQEFEDMSHLESSDPLRGADHVLVDIENEEFFPNTPEVRKLVNEVHELAIRSQDIHEELANIWLEQFAENA